MPLTTIDKELILLPFTSQGYRHRFAQLVRFGMGCLTTWRLCDCTVIVRSHPRMAAAMRVHIVAWIIFYFIFNYLFLLISAIDTDRRVVSSGKRSASSTAVVIPQTTATGAIMMKKNFNKKKKLRRKCACSVLSTSFTSFKSRLIKILLLHFLIVESKMISYF